MGVNFFPENELLIQRMKAILIKLKILTFCFEI